MRSATVVIGANWGDEGKGAAVDITAANIVNPLVVRFNGGAQAAHTVQVGDKRHVFSHFGSGTFVGAPTYLSKFFVANPTLFLKEQKELLKLGLSPEVGISPEALVTTPYDVLLNQWAEEYRGASRHGSCGVGFNETIERNLWGDTLVCADLGEEAVLRKKLRGVKNYAYARIGRLGIALAHDHERAGILASERLVEDWIKEAQEFAQAVGVCSMPEAIWNRSLIFEGAQGLLLDQESGDSFPHLTRSNTGLTNVGVLAKEAGIDHLDVLYMTRPYWTRHGAGPLPGEVSQLGFANVVDPTNKAGPWQGPLRVARLDPAKLARTITRDYTVNAIPGIRISPCLGISCLDQLKHPAAAEECIHVLEEATKLPVFLEGWGPDRSNYTGCRGWLAN